MLEVGKTYQHGHSIDKNNKFKITERATNFFVGVSLISQRRWLFDSDGNAIACFGTTVIPKFNIVPIPEEEVVYVRVNNWGDTSISSEPNLGTAVTDIKVTYHDGIAVSAELNQANESPTSRSRLLGK